VAAGLRAQRNGAGPGTWLALAASGAVLTLARSFGPVLFLVLAVTLVALHGIAPARQLWRERPRGAAIAVAVLAVALGVGVWWDLAEQPHGVDGGPGFGIALKQSFHDLDDVARHAVGSFGALDTPLPDALYALWGLAALLLAGLALVLGSARERADVLLTVAVALGVTVAVSLFQLRTGYGVQGRHVLPVLVLVPLWAGEVLWRHGASRHGAVIAAGAAGAQLVAWWANARRQAIGADGSWWFVGAAEWSPPGGWWPWLIVAAAGAGLVAFSAARAGARGRPPRAATAP